MKHKLLVLFFFSLLSNSWAGQPVIDSLEALLHSETSLKVQLQIKNKIAFNYYRIDPSKTVSMSLENIELAKSIGDEESRLGAINNLAIGQVFQNESLKALETFELLEEEGQNGGFMTIVHRACNNKGNIYSDIGQDEKAVNAFHQAMSIAKMQKDDDAYCIYLNNLVGMLMKQGEFAKAERYYENALPVAKKLKNKSILADMYHGLGQLNEHLDKDDDALNYFQESLDLSRITQDKHSQIGSLNSISQLLRQKGQTRKALAYNKEALQIAENSGSSRVKTPAYLALAKSFMTMKDYDQSIYYSQLGLETAKLSHNIAITVEFYELLAEAHEGNQDFQAALNNQKIFKSVQDSLAELNQMQKIKEVSLKYDIEARDEENDKLRIQQQQQLLAIRMKNLLAILVGTALLFVSVISLMLYRNNRRKYKYNQQLEEEVKLSTDDLKQSNLQLHKKNKELERFAHIASHDLKEPLRNITSFIRLIERRLEGKNEHLKEYLQFVQNNAKQMHILIEDVLEFSKLNEVQPVFEKVDVSTTLKQVSMGMEQFLVENNAVLEIGEMPEIHSSGSQLYLLFKNIIENGVIFNDSKQPMIEIDYSQEGDNHVFSISDNGIGIEKQYQSKIFGMFNRLNDRVKHQGSGLGLSICKKIASRLQGDICMESEKNIGSTFFIKLPVAPNMNNKGNVTFSVVHEPSKELSAVEEFN